MAAALCFLLLLPDELIQEIFLRVIEDGNVLNYLWLRGACVQSRRFCDDTAVIHSRSLREHRYYTWRRLPVANLRFEERFRLAGHREAICYEGMEILMTRKVQSWVSVGLELVRRAADAGDSTAAYFLAMMKYRLNLNSCT